MEVRLRRKDCGGGFIGEVVGYGHLPLSLRDLERQRHRWAGGYPHTQMAHGLAILSGCDDIASQHRRAGFSQLSASQNLPLVSTLTLPMALLRGQGRSLPVTMAVASILPTCTDRVFLFDRCSLNERTVLRILPDGAADETGAVASSFIDGPAPTCVRPARNIGTAQTKIAVLLLIEGDGVTFQERNDILLCEKVLCEARILPRSAVGANEYRNGRTDGNEQKSVLQIEAALVLNGLNLSEGHRVTTRHSLPMSDDMLSIFRTGPTLARARNLIDLDLFRQEVLARNGGFRACIDEDRKFRARLILDIEIDWIVLDLPSAKIETADILTLSKDIVCDSDRRVADRKLVRDKLRVRRSRGRVDAVPVNMPDPEIAFVSKPHSLRAREMPKTGAARFTRVRCFGRAKGAAAADKGAAQ